jgi:glycerol-3-phosphate dehydrogenase
VRARVTVNAAGAHAGEIMTMFGVGREFPLVRAMNLVTSKPASDMALAARAASGVTLTLVPWHGRALIGTSQSAEFQQPGDMAVTAAEIDAFVADANSAFPALRLSRADVTFVHRANVPAERGPHGQPRFLGAPVILDPARNGAAGAISVIGVKFTTARAVGQRAAAAAARALGRSTRKPDTAGAILPGAAIADHEALAIETARTVGLEVAPPIVGHLMDIYGDRCAAIVRLMAERSDWRMPLVPGKPNVGAEVIHAIRAEMACTLADIVIRRTELGAAAYPGDAIVTTAAAIAAEELGWDANRRDGEIAAVREFYAIGELVKS